MRLHSGTTIDSCCRSLCCEGLERDSTESLLASSPRGISELRSRWNLGKKFGGIAPCNGRGGLRGELTTPANSDPDGSDRTRSRVSFFSISYESFSEISDRGGETAIGTPLPCRHSDRLAQLPLGVAFTATGCLPCVHCDRIP